MFLYLQIPATATATATECTSATSNDTMRSVEEEVVFGESLIRAIAIRNSLKRYLHSAQSVLINHVSYVLFGCLMNFCTSSAKMHERMMVRCVVSTLNPIHVEVIVERNYNKSMGSLILLSPSMSPENRGFHARPSDSVHVFLYRMYSARSSTYRKSIYK